MKNLTLVLNADDIPLNVATQVRAFNLVFKGKATIVSHDEGNPMLSEYNSYKRPIIIRLTKWVYVPHKKQMPLTRHNIYKRDGHQCMYCPSTKKLTLDHVLPKSKGGKNTWENLATCCGKCNSKKDNKTLEEAGMKLRFMPFAPDYAFFVNFTSVEHAHWTKYFEDKKKKGY